MKLYAVVAVNSSMVIGDKAFPGPVVVKKPADKDAQDIWNRPMAPAIFTSEKNANRFISTLPKNTLYAVEEFTSAWTG